MLIIKILFMKKVFFLHFLCAACQILIPHTSCLFSLSLVYHGKFFNLFCVRFVYTSDLHPKKEIFFPSSHRNHENIFSLT